MINELTNPKITSSSPLAVARFYKQSFIDAQTDEKNKTFFGNLRNAYINLFGSPSGDEYSNEEKKDKTFYASFIIEDKARYFDTPKDVPAGKIPNQHTGAANVGNTSTKYYLQNTKLSEIVYSNDPKYKNPNINSDIIADIIAGISTTYTDRERKEILDLFNEVDTNGLAKNFVPCASVDASGNILGIDITKSSKFVLNPDVSPRYKVSNTGNLLAEDAAHKLPSYMSGDCIFEISSGADLGNLKPETFKITLSKMKNTETDPSKPAKYEKEGTPFVLMKEKESANNLDKTLNEKINISDKVPAGFLLDNEVYLVELTGQDIDGNDIVPANDEKGKAQQFAFRYGSADEPPKLNIITPKFDNEIYKSGVQIILEGTASSAKKGLKDFDEANKKAPIVITDGLDTTNSGTYTDNGTYYVKVDSDGKWNLTLTSADVGSVSAKKIVQGKHHFTVTAYDKADQKTILQKYVTVDIKPPVWNDGVNDTRPKAEKANGSWYNTDAIIIKAKAYDDVFSSVAKLVYEGGSTSGVQEAGNGNFSVVLKDGENAIKVKAVDIAGNETDEVVISAKLDKTLPTLGDVKLAGNSVKAGQVLTNKSADVTLLFTATDTGSGAVATANDEHLPRILGSDGSSIIAKATKTPNTDEYSITIPKEKIAEGAVQLVITDNAGNERSENAFSFRVDDKAPTLAFNAPNENAVVNKTITVSGTVFDNIETPQKVRLSYLTATSPETYSDQIEITQSDGSWTTIIDTVNALFADADNSAEGKQLKLKLTAKDAAGNTSELTRVLTVDQDSDRPVINFGSLEFDSENTSSKRTVLLYTKTLVGRIEDDDGIISGANKLFWRKKNATSWSTDNLTLKEGGNFTLMLDDGDFDIEFKVIDNAGTEFYTGASGHPSGIKEYPKFADGSATPKILSENAQLYLTVNNAPPKIQKVTYEVWNAETGNWEASSGKFGGAYQKVRAYAEVQDENGISEVTLDINGQKVPLVYDSDTSDGFKKYKPNTDTTKESVDISSLPSTNYQCVIEAKDTATLSQTDQSTITVDNTKPIPYINTFTPNLIAGVQQMSGGCNEELCTYWYGVSKVANTQPKDTLVTNTSTAWKKMSDTSSYNWTAQFDGKPTTAMQIHESLFSTFIPTLGIAEESAISSGTYTTITDLYFWIKARDANGNLGYKEMKVQVDPQGKRPRVVLNEPDATVTFGSTPPTLGGQIKLYGSVLTSTIDGRKPKYVFVQIDPSTETATTGDWSFTEDMKTALEAKGYTSPNYVFGNMENPTSSSLNSDYTKNGIRCEVVNGTWSLTINKSNEFDPTGGGTRFLNIQLFATDEGTSADILYSLTPVRAIVEIDNESPRMPNIKLVQYDSAKQKIAEKAYELDIAVSGSGWYLEADIEDGTGIKQIIKKDDLTGISSTPIGSAGGSNDEFIQKGSALTGGAYNYHMKVKVGSDVQDSVGKNYYTITATENNNANRIVEKTFKIRYDNKKPVLGNAGEEGYKLSNQVQNVNSFYTLESFAKEEAVSNVEQTGVGSVAFYFTRKVGSDPEVIFDPLLLKNNSLNKQKLPTTRDKGLYWKELSVNSNTEYNLTLANTNDDLHVGALLKIAGALYTVAGITGTQITVSPKLPEGLTASEIEYALALVVDAGTETGDGAKNSRGYFNTINFGDSDDIVESLTSVGSKYTWQASINSNNIPDGPVTLHYVVFDKAGNYAEGEVKDCFVKNNAPRIAGLKLGTDDNGNGSIDGDKTATTNNGEWIVVYHDVYQNGNYAVKAASETKFPNYDENKANSIKSILNVKGDTKLVPEIVGGNGVMSYTFDVAQFDTSTNKWASPYKSNITGKTTTLGSAKDYNDKAEYGTDVVAPEIILDIASITENGIKNGAKQKFSFIIKDSTVGNSQIAKMHVVMDVSAIDVTPPDTYLLPFYWESEEKNSLFQNKRENGHIELQASLPSASGTSGEFDKDAKLSGKVKIEGIAHDEILLKELSLSFEGISIGTIATYDATNAKWKVTSEHELDPSGNIPSSGWVASVEQATYGDYERFMKQTNAGYTIPSEFTRDNKVPYTSQDKGHIVHWTVYLDTEKITGAVGLDKKINASAKDRGKPAWSGSAVTYTQNSSTVKSGNTGGDDGNGALTNENCVDIVPYVTGVKNTAAGDGLSARAIRSADGSYSISNKAGNITISGYNLKASVNPTVKVGAVTLTVSSSDIHSVQVNRSAVKSGELSVSVGTITSINNYCDEKKPYNSEADITNASSNLWNVKRKIIAWQNTQLSSLKQSSFQYPSMVMDGTGKPIFAYCDISTGYSYRTENDTTEKKLGGRWAEINAEIAKTSDGKYMVLSVENNFDSSQYSGYLYLNSDDSEGNTQVGSDGYTKSIPRYASPAGFIELVNGSYGNANWNEPALNRFLYPNLYVNGSQTNAQIAISYYDKKQKEIRFFAFKKTGASSTNLNEAGNTGGAVNNYYGQVITHGTDQIAENGNCQVASNLDTGSARTDMVVLGTGSSAKVYIVYYDGTADALCLAYSTNAILSTGLANPSATWNTVNVATGKASYPSMKVNNNTLYIAYQDGNNATLKMATVDISTTPSVKSNVLVDASSQVGQKTNIVIIDGLPYISYYDNAGVNSLSCIKMAYPTVSANATKAGAKDDKSFTGNWVVTYVPAVAIVSDENASVFNSTMIDAYGTTASKPPVLGWLGETYLEYAVLLKQ